VFAEFGLDRYERMDVNECLFRAIRIMESDADHSQAQSVFNSRVA
jgi:hypothetical protein